MRSRREEQHRQRAGDTGGEMMSKRGGMGAAVGILGGGRQERLGWASKGAHGARSRKGPRGGQPLVDKTDCTRAQQP